MDDIFPDTHAIIAKKVVSEVRNKYGIELNEKKFVWGSKAPDFLPKYKLYRHYRDESENFIINEIIGLIYVARLFNFKNLDKLKNKLLSRKLGIISHYLCDYVCLAHKERWTFKDSFSKHVQYERKLNEIAQGHDFNIDAIESSFSDLYKNETIFLKSIVKEYINNVIDEYSKSTSMERDLDFGLSFSYGITSFVIETVGELNKVQDQAYSFVF